MTVRLTDSVQLQAIINNHRRHGGTSSKIRPAAAAATPIACQLQRLLGVTNVTALARSGSVVEGADDATTRAALALADPILDMRIQA